MVDEVTKWWEDHTSEGDKFTKINEMVNALGTDRSQQFIGGGGTVTVDGSYRFGWSQRFIAICMGYGSHFSTNGYFDITQPTSGTITAVGGGTANTWNSSGIIIPSWQALYYILPIGSSSTSVAGNFRMVGYTSSLKVPDNWVMIAYKNGDQNKIYVTALGLMLNASETWNTGDTIPSLTGGGWPYQRETFKIGDILFYDNFSKYANGDNVGGVVETHYDGAGVATFLVSNLQSHEGSNSLRFEYTGSTSGLGYTAYYQYVPCGVAPCMKISFWLYFGDTNSNAAGHYLYGIFWDASASAWSVNLVAGFSRSSGQLRVYNGAWNNVRTYSASTWYEIILFFRFDDRVSSGVPQMAASVGGTLFNSGNYSNMSHLGAGDHCLAIHFFYHYWYWDRSEYIDQIKFEVGDPYDDTPFT